jgi:dipeptidyl aminopeptidase/acylaminoacyl peptidase
MNNFEFGRFLAALTSIAIAIHPVYASARPFEIEDQLRQEAIDRAFFSPDGSEILVEYSGPWKSLSDPGLFSGDGRFDRLGSATLLRSSLASPDKMTPIFPAEPGAGYWVDAFSPDGRLVAISWIKDRTHHAGVLNLSSGKLVRLPIVPYFSFLQQRPVWVSNKELVYSITTSGRISREVFYRAAAADWLASMWDRSWKGREPSVTVLKSGTGDVTDETSSEAGGLVKVSAITGAVTPLGEGIFSDLTLSPDRKFIAALKLGGITQPPTEKASLGLRGRLAQPELFDLSSGRRTTPCNRCQALTGSLAWSPDSKDLYLFSKSTNSDWTLGNLTRTEINSNKTTQINLRRLKINSEADRGGRFRISRFVPVPGGVLVSARSDESGSAAHDSPGLNSSGWFYVSSIGKIIRVSAGLRSDSMRLLGSSDSSVFVLAGGTVWRLSPSHPPVNITPRLNGDLEYLNIRTGAGSGSDLSYFQSDLSSYPNISLRRRDERGTVVLLDLNSGSLVEIGSPSREAAVIAVSYLGRAVLFRADTDAGTIISLSKQGKKNVEVRHLNPHFAQVEPARRMSIPFTLAGEELKGCARLPKNWDGKVSLPAIIEVYPNSQPDCERDTGIVPDRELFTSWGYIYFEFQAPRNVIKSPDGPIGGMPKLINAAVDALVSQTGADPDRLGLYGYSQGGYVAPWLLTQTKRFRAAVAINGWADHASLYGQPPVMVSVFPNEWLDLVSSELGAPLRYEDENSNFFLSGAPWQVPIRYGKSSAYMLADQIKTPLMLVHSDLDSFPMQQYEMLFSALYRQRKDAQLVRYWGEGHTRSSPANFEDQWTRIKNWFARYLNASRSVPK